MKYALTLAEDNRILSATYAAYASDKTVPVDSLPEGDVHDYKYVNGEYVYDPLPKPEPPEPEPDYEARIAALEEELAAAKILLGVE